MCQRKFINLSIRVHNIFFWCWKISELVGDGRWTSFHMGTRSELQKVKLNGRIVISTCKCELQLPIRSLMSIIEPSASRTDSRMILYLLGSNCDRWAEVFFAWDAVYRTELHSLSVLNRLATITDRSIFPEEWISMKRRGHKVLTQCFGLRWGAEDQVKLKVSLKPHPNRQKCKSKSSQDNLLSSAPNSTRK